MIDDCKARAGNTCTTNAAITARTTIAACAAVAARATIIATAAVATISAVATIAACASYTCFTTGAARNGYPGSNGDRGIGTCYSCFTAAAGCTNRAIRSSRTWCPIATVGAVGTGSAFSALGIRHVTACIATQNSGGVRVPRKSRQGGGERRGQGYDRNGTAN